MKQLFRLKGNPTQKILFLSTGFYRANRMPAVPVVNGTVIAPAVGRINFREEEKCLRSQLIIKKE